MNIKFWGTRGSIPVPDKRMIRFGGNTTCVEVEIGKKTLIIDAGTGIHRLGEHLSRKNIHDISLFITHSHWDHIQGFPFFMPIYSKKTKINILGCTSSYSKLSDILSNQMSSEYFPVPFSELTSKIIFTDACALYYEIEGHKISFIRANHPAFTMGIKIENGSGAFVFITDNELEAETQHTKYGRFVEFCAGAEYLVHDAQFTDREYKHRKGWGHSTYEQVVKLASDAKVKSVGFTHHDPNRTDRELDEIQSAYRRFCRTAKYECKPHVVREGMEKRI
ncbi:MAG TPA: MBL fold metallo-hydrolase [Elusimicrobia bacterium]|nr:MAG: hypothetical protein A2278_02520 [Elusimicrobia bacterium RIFOXYA12_FULL_49_49]OGS09255.1 MAG: hypothetical protein A2204_06305 [Elusimicrobia bacterium RIFOXYA1_FULL_47_7]OGS10899.1 MAG: hypothetical protein A2386_06520 [Elusimicrobia bacterium RIFOXYB1_FULL_48_9]OGS16357.1 MAG: hypothetical protein A2251_05970 [Elusimicrobia bacterium RIFOXYA2_FULL_47_53]OGS27263.1 MAG: hypothetical protein A2339_08205 [Elusimicrobia bacterium RIFOXYB12_FULL_50_12]OGS30465.1 MAG: hypothetical protein